MGALLSALATAPLECHSPSPLELDLNQLQTALNAAIAGENFELAAKIWDVLQQAAGGGDAAAATAADWRRLGVLDWLADRAEQLGFRLPTEVQKRSAPVILDRDDCIIQSQTGSGKTLAFLMPLLSCLLYPPELYPDDLQGPQAVIIVPTRELGVQVVMLIYKLFGGSVNVGIPGTGGNIFQYDGPRGLKVKGLLLDEELELVTQAYYLRGAHVVVGTPELLSAALHTSEGAELLQHTQVVAVDEVDLCFQERPFEMEELLQSACSQQIKPTVVFVGATLGDGVAEEAVARGWLQDPVRVVVGEEMEVPRGLSHRYLVVEERRKLAAMARQLRLDLRQQGQDAAPARVMVFASSEDQAQALADPLRTVLWGDHKLSVLLPSGVEPIQALHSFRDNKATLLLATPAAARGLDLPAVSHVYNTAVPADATDYLHRAGRAGRIGSPVAGLITTIVSPGEEEERLLQLAEELGIELEQEAEPGPELDAAQEAATRLLLEEQQGQQQQVGAQDLDKLRSGLEDLFHMF
ncbi:hypothetical protein N2152v2_010448 [Parachlorella kessleri]